MRLPGRLDGRARQGCTPASYAPRMDISSAAALPPHLLQRAQQSAQAVLGRSSTTASAAAQLASPMGAWQGVTGASSSGESSVAALGESDAGAVAQDVDALAAGASWPRGSEEQLSREEASHSDRVRCQAGAAAAQLPHPLPQPAVAEMLQWACYAESACGWCGR